MAQSARIDGVSFPGSGGVQVDFTRGPAPLPTASGTGEFYTDKAALAAAIEDAELQVAPFLHLIALAPWVKSDPNMLNPNSAKNKTATIDLAGTSTAIAVG